MDEASTGLRAPHGCDARAGSASEISAEIDLGRVLKAACVSAANEALTSNEDMASISAELGVLRREVGAIKSQLKEELRHIIRAEVVLELRGGPGSCCVGAEASRSEPCSTCGSGRDPRRLQLAAELDGIRTEFGNDIRRLSDECNRQLRTLEAKVNGLQAVREDRDVACIAREGPPCRDECAVADCSPSAETVRPPSTASELQTDGLAPSCSSSPGPVPYPPSHSSTPAPRFAMTPDLSSDHGVAMQPALRLPPSRPQSLRQKAFCLGKINTHSMLSTYVANRGPLYRRPASALDSRGWNW